MKKLQSVVLTSILLLVVVTGVQAAPVLWDQPRPTHSTPSGNYAIPPSLNGGNFIYYPSYFNTTNYGTGNSSAVLSVPAFDQTTDTFGPNPGQMDFIAEAGGGVLPDGLFNTGYAQITATDFDENNGVDNGHQRFSSDTFRNFIPSGPGVINVTADITGSISWPIENYDLGGMYPGPIDPFSPYSAYELQGKVEILTLSISGGGSQVALIDPIELDNTTLSGSIQFNADINPDIYYVLHTSLLIDTYAANADFMGFILGDFPDGLAIGESLENPLALTASVTQSAVPIPGSLILLASGLGGLAIRRKMAKS